MDIERAVYEIALAVVREFPAMAFGIFMILIGLVVWLKMAPAVIKYYQDRGAIEAARELRKKDESAERLIREGQWISAMERGNDNSAEQNLLQRKLLDKFDHDNEQGRRLESKICEVHKDMKELTGYMKGK